MFFRQFKKETLEDFQKKRIRYKKDGEIVLNYVVIGNYSTKTAFITQYTEGVLLPSTHPFVVGIEFDQIKYVDKNNHALSIQLWDTGELICYVPLISTYLRRAVCSIIVVEMEKELASSASIDGLQRLLDVNNVLKERIGNPYFVTAVVGCYRKKESLKLSHDDVMQFAQKNKIDASLCFEVDVTNKEQVDSVFAAINNRVILINKLAVDLPGKYPEEKKPEEKKLEEKKLEEKKPGWCRIV